MGTQIQGFSDVECACRCGNLLPERIVALGRRYLHGHKPEHQKVIRNHDRSKRLDAVGKVMSGMTALGTALQFAEAEVQSLRAQMEVGRNEAVRLAEAEIDILRRLEKLVPTVEGLKLLMGEKGTIEQ